MAVAVENRSLLHPLPLCGSSWCGAFIPPLRQTAGRYVKWLMRAKTIPQDICESQKVVYTRVQDKLQYEEVQHVF